MTKRRNCRGDRATGRGGALLELALCAPVLLYMLVGVADFARYYTESSQAGEAAAYAARRGAAPSVEDGLPATTVDVETFCECPFEPNVRFTCGERSCGEYGEPARYSQATVGRPFSFIGRYPGFPKEFEIRRKAGVRLR